MALLVASLLLGSAASHAAAQALPEVRLDLSPQLFTVLCAVQVGVDAPLRRGTPAGSGVAAQVEQALRQLPPEVTQPLRDYFRAKRVKGLPEELTPYISLALTVDGPPEFNFRFPQKQLPPDVYELVELQPLLKEFYERAQLAKLRQQVLSEYAQAVVRWQGETARRLLETRAYLRLIEERHPGRSYVAYLEWLVPRGLTSGRNYGLDYFLVIHPQREDLLDVVRHQYLHFLVDSLVSRQASELGSWAPLRSIAERAPRLPETFRSDLLLLVSESLIQAIEFRIQRLDAAVAAAEVNRAEREGYLFVRHFFHALEGFEQAEPSFRFYFPDLLREFSVAQEKERLAQVEFAPALPPVAVPVAPPAPDSSRALLEEAQRQLQAGDYAAARAGFGRVLREVDPEEPRALYGLAIVASQQQDQELAKSYFLFVLKRAREPFLLGWTHLYLGRIYDLEGSREQALGHYQAALSLESGLEQIEEAARRGLGEPFGQSEEPGRGQPN